MTVDQRLRRLTKRQVDALMPGAYIFCAESPGFGVRCQRKAKTFIYRYRLDGRRTYVTIGVHGRPWTVETARAQAKQYAAMVARGIDPAAEKRQRQTGIITFGAVVERFLTEHVEPKRKKSTAVEYRRMLERDAVPLFGARRIDAITHNEIARLHHRMRATPYQANRMVAVLSKLFSWAESHGYCSDLKNPCQGIEKYREQGRERFLTSEELARLGDALREMECENAIDPYAAAAIRLLILTGARRGEILSLRWEWIDQRVGTARLPDSKTGRKSINFPPPVLDILSKLPRLEGNPHVICGHRAGAHLVGLPKIWERVRAHAALKDVRIHDLRHSFASVAAGSGASLIVIGKLLGHSQPTTTQRYAHLGTDPVKEAGDATAAHISQAMGGDNGDI